VKCRAGHEHSSIVAAAACDKNPEPKRCDENAGGCGRSAQEGAAFRGGSALCESCKEAIGEAEADDAAKLEAAEALVAKHRAARRQEAAKNWKGIAEQPNVVKVQQLADAFHEVGKINHYMVGVTCGFDREELEAAEQVLIDRQNAGPQKGKAFQALERALDEIEHARFVKFAQAEREKKEEPACGDEHASGLLCQKKQNHSGRHRGGGLVWGEAAEGGAK
jgi:hypothetical protein